MKVYVLEVGFSFNGKDDALYPVILEHEQEMILVDCGYAGFLPLLEQVAQLKGISLQKLTGILITHHDIDHMGALAEFKREFPGLKIYSSVIEERYISGKQKSLRLVQAENMYDSLPEEYKPGARHFQDMLRAMEPVEVNQTLLENEPLPILNDVHVIATPGHMPGHISLYLKESKTLIAADALVVEGGELEIANPHFTLDLPLAIKSVEKLLNLEIDKIVCYHGGVVEDNIHQKISDLLSRYSHLTAQ
jgi:glyoxylase-like metal-dependent hydrolase (beta-lactamase superfamily II)